MTEQLTGEQDIQDYVVEYFRNQGMICFPDKFLNWRTKFSVYDSTSTPPQNREPDVVAYKWKDDRISLDVRGVECKTSGTYSSVRSALDQAKMYQRHIPWCYVATETSTLSLDFLKSEHLGYLPVSSASVEIDKISECFDILLNTRLDSRQYELTRQKIAAFDCFTRIYGKNIQFGFNGDHVFASTKENAQNHITNYFQDSDFSCGLDIEKQQPVRETILGRMEEIQKILSSSDWIDHFVSFGIREYEMKNQRMDMKVLEKPCKTFTPSDAQKIESVMKEYNCQVVFLILKKAWRRDELLSQQEHEQILRSEANVMSELKKRMNWH